MRDEATHANRPWVAPEVCPTGNRAQPSTSNLHRAIEQADAALRQRSIGAVARALVVVRAALQARLAEETTPGSWEHDGPPVGPWQRRLRRRCAASLCAVERLLDDAWTSCDLDAVASAVRGELSKLRHLESLEDRAHLDLYWTDIGVGD